MFSCSDTTPVCRGCGSALRGAPYRTGGRAYLPLPKGGEAKVNFYGGWVCSRECDVRASREQEDSMPGAGPRGNHSLSPYATSRIRSNWEA